MTFNREQRAVVEVGGNVAVTIDGIECVVVRADVFETLRKSLGDDWNHDDLRASLARSYESSDWNDPSMDVYDEYDQHP